MRSLHADLLTSQRSSTGRAYVVVELTKSGSPSYTYETSQTHGGRLFGITHTEGAYSGGAIIRLKNHDKALTNKNFQGYKAAMKWGFWTASGGRTSVSAPMYVWSQRFISEEGELLLELTCVDDWERMARYIVSGATAGPRPTWENTSVKAMIEQLLSEALGISLIVDSQDSQAQNYKPEYGVDRNTPVRTVIRQLLGMTECAIKMRDNGAHLIHLQDIDPIDYQYDTAHAFYSDVREQAAPAYNEILVQNRELGEGETSSAEGYFYALASDSGSVAKFGSIPQVITLSWVQSDGEASTLANTLLERAEAEAAQGTIIVPMNCGQEVYDKVKVTDSRAGQTLIGRVGQLTRVFASGEYRLEIRLGGVTATGLFPGPDALISDITGLTTYPTYQYSQYGGGIPLGAFGRWILPIAVNIEFTAVSWKKATWTSGSIGFADGGSQSINAGSITLSSYGQRRYLYFKLGSNTLHSTSNFSTAACGNDRGIVALLQAGSDSLQMIMILTFRGTVPTLNADAIANGAITAALLKKTAQPWNCSVTFSGAGWNVVQWSSGNIAFADGSTYSINSGSLGGIPANRTRYVYYVLGDPNLKTTGSYTAAIGDEKALLCIVTTGTSTKGDSPVILPMTSKGLTVNAVAICADSITGDHIQAKTIVGYDLIIDGTITAPLITVANLSVIGNADMGLLTAGEIRLGKGSLGNFTGWRLWEEGGVGRMAGYQSGDVHWYSDSQGRLVGAGGNFRVEKTGVYCYLLSSFPNAWLNLHGKAGLTLVRVGGLEIRLVSDVIQFRHTGSHFGTIYRYNHGLVLESNRDLRLIPAVGYEAVTNRLSISDYCNPSNDLGASIGTDGNRFFRGRIWDIESFYNRPANSNTGYCGSSSQYWLYGYFNQLRYKSASPFQKHDDIALVKSMKPDKKNPKVLIIPDEIKSVSEDGKLEDFIDMGNFSGLIVGTLQNIIGRLEELEGES